MLSPVEFGRRQKITREGVQETLGYSDIVASDDDITGVHTDAQLQGGRIVRQSRLNFGSAISGIEDACEIGQRPCPPSA